jgi:hypothetical protein
MKSVLLVGCFLVASPAFSQTQRDLPADRGLVVSTGFVKLSPAEAAAILAPNQFQFLPALPPGPRVLGLLSSPTGGPFGEFPEFSPARRLDGTLLSDPQWGVTTWIPYGGWGPGYGGTYGRAGASRGHRAPGASAAQRPAARRPR